MINVVAIPTEKKSEEIYLQGAYGFLAFSREGNPVVCIMEEEGERIITFESGILLSERFAPKVQCVKKWCAARNYTLDRILLENEDFHIVVEVLF